MEETMISTLALLTVIALPSNYQQCPLRARVQASRHAYAQPGRLPDIMTLIQVLANSDSSRMRGAAIEKLLDAPPASANDWVGVGCEHPEFFRVCDREPVCVPASVALVARLVQSARAADSIGLDTRSRDGLLGLAVQLYDREILEQNRWKEFFPLIIAGVAALASIASAGTAYVLGRVLASATRTSRIVTPSL
jgi:hypothetical protein